MKNKDIYNLSDEDIQQLKDVIGHNFKFKVSQLVSSIQTLRMIETKAEYKASVYYNEEDIKNEWLQLFCESNELLELYENIDIANKDLIKDYYIQEGVLYFKMKILNEKCKPKKERLRSE